MSTDRLNGTPGALRRPMGLGRDFYCSFYRAVRYGGVQADTASVELPAKHQLKGTIRYWLVRAEIAIGDLITRRSQVQILPPPPTTGRKPRSLTWAFDVVGRIYRVSVVFNRLSCVDLDRLGCPVTDRSETGTFPLRSSVARSRRREGGQPWACSDGTRTRLRRASGS